MIRLEERAALAPRLHRLREELEAIIRRLAPEAAAVETPFHGANVRSALALAHARGVVLEVLAGSGVAIHEYAPAAVKKAVTGSGRAEKGQVQRMVAALLGRGDVGTDTDTADALATALCHMATSEFRRAVERGGRAASSKGDRPRRVSAESTVTK